MTLAKATELYNLWLAAYEAAAQGKSYTINTGGTSRTLTRQDLPSIKREMDYWDNQVKALTNSQSGMRVKFGTTA